MGGGAVSRRCHPPVKMVRVSNVAMCESHRRARKARVASVGTLAAAVTPEREAPTVMPARPPALERDSVQVLRRGVVLGLALASAWLVALTR